MEKEATKTLAISQKKEWAKMLYIRNELTQKEIALKVEVSEKTLSKWANENDNEWDKQRKSLLTTKPEQLKYLYNQLDAIHKHIASKEEGKRYADSKEADIISKTTASIKNLETETSLGQVIEVASAFVRFVQKENLDDAQKITGWFNAFIKEKQQ
jgi:DNA-binding XRE family transcriptional regulator